MRLALGGGRGRGRRVPIHDTWRREHNIWAGGWGVRITIRIRGRRIVPGIGARRWWIWCTRKGLGRVLGQRRWVGCLFGPRGSRLFLVTAHEIFLSGVGVVLRWHGEGDKYVAGYPGHNASRTRLVEQEQGEDGWEREKRTAYLGCGRSGFQDLVAAQTQAGDGAPPQFRANWLISRPANSRCNRFLAKISCPKRCGGGNPAGVDDEVRRDGAMPVHV
jgi:hypothetical protein